MGRRLIPQLLEAGYRVRTLGRSLKKMQCRPWAGHSNVELAQGDVLELASLEKAARGCGGAFFPRSFHGGGTRHVYRSRSPGSPKYSYRATAAAGLERLIYLGAGKPEDPNLSEHLRSRTEVARILQSGPTPTTFLRPP